MTMPSPLFIALEGIDGSGKGTQVERLTGWFRAAGRPVHATGEPSGGPIGLLLRQALAGQIDRAGEVPSRPLDEAAMALLFAADRMDHLAAEIVPRLEAGVSVICDRYVLSTYAYQGVGIDEGWLRALNSRARMPDLTLLIDLSAVEGMARMRARGKAERYEQDALQARVRERFLRLAASLHEDGRAVAVIDGTGTPGQVHEEIVRYVRDALAM